MGTEQPDTERMHRLFDAALDDADLTGDVVPGVLTGYEHQVKVRRYQSAGVALAVLATAGAAISALPRGGGAGGASTSSAPTRQGPDYCKHQHWISTPVAVMNANEGLSQSPAPDQANCEALQTAIQAVFPEARLVPEFASDLTLDPRVDQALVTKVKTELMHDPRQGTADEMKYFGSELKYLAVHPDDPANVYQPGGYTLIMPAGRESFGVGYQNEPYDPKTPMTFVWSASAIDCANMPAALKKTVQCAPVGAAGGWHGGLWNSPPGGVDPAKQTAVLTDGPGRYVMVSGSGSDDEAWYREGTNDSGSGLSDTWINRWTGQTAVGNNPPASHALTQKQWDQLLASSAFKKFADSYLDYVGSLPPGPTAAPSSAHSH
jgi:hypothetical protein